MNVPGYYGFFTYSIFRGTSWNRFVKTISHGLSSIHHSCSHSRLSQNAFQGTMIWSPFIAEERLVVLLEIATVGNVQKWWHHFLLGTI
ncbi:MAG: hypothetical protein ACQEQO_11020, partial [Thermodesulfobacteriota bacterium]